MKDNNWNILNLPPEIIVEILSFCETVDVFSFAKASEENKSDIWEILASGNLLKEVVIPPEDGILKVIARFGGMVKNLKILGSEEKLFDGCENPLGDADSSLANFEKKDADGKWKLTKSLILSIQVTCTALEKLTISNCVFDSREIKLDMFPQTITHLSFEDVSIPISGRNRALSSVESSPFFKIQESLPLLKCLEVEGETRYLSDLLAAALEDFTYDNMINKTNYTWPHVTFSENKYSVKKIEDKVEEELIEDEREYFEEYKRAGGGGSHLIKYITDNNFGHFIVDARMGCFGVD